MLCISICVLRTSSTCSRWSSADALGRVGWGGCWTVGLAVWRFRGRALEIGGMKVVSLVMVSEVEIERAAKLIQHDVRY